ncbi:MAG: M48 family metalloprotease, partial [Candidatus Hodarchaeota archaeon]
MPVRLWARSMIVISILFAMMFALGMVVLTALELYFGPFLGDLAIFVYLGFAFVVVALQFLIAPFLLDLTMSWFHKFRWVNVNELPPYMPEFIANLQQSYGFSWGRIGILEDLNPNAFTYGRFRRNARLVLTQGIFHFLEEEEVKAVVAHEAGHVRNRDFFWMTVASAVPIFCYAIYRSIVRSQMLKARGGGKEKGQAIIILMAVAVVC